MKILLLNYEYPPLGGGAGVCSKYHAEGLAVLGHDITILTAWFDGEQTNEDFDNLKIIRVKSIRKFIHRSDPVEMLSWVFKAKKYFKQNLSNYNFDVCLANFAIPGGLVAEFIKKKYKIPFVIISHGQDVPWFFPKQLLFYHSVLYLKLCSLFRYSLRNILLTESMKSSVDKLVGKKKISKNVIIPNGCNTDFFKPEYSLRSRDFKIIFVGRLREQKDPMIFLKAVKVLSDRKLPFTATIIGDGPMRNEIENYILKNQLDNIVKVIGWVDKNKMLQEYQNSSLLVSTSLDEGMSIALLEALSSGLYVIATPASGNREMISEKVNGEIVQFKAHNKLADSIEYFYKHRFLNGYITPDEFLDKFREKYSWKNIVDEYDKLLRSLFS
jgi:glycosyltransferase involved in cell wall biosynthesis